MTIFGIFGKGASRPAGWFAGLCAVGAVMAGASAVPALASSSSAGGLVNATVIQPLTLTHSGNNGFWWGGGSHAALDFGKFTAGAGGSVTVTASGAGSTLGDVAFVPGSSTAADSFTVQGDGGRSYAIVSGPGTVSNGTATMAFTTQPSASSLSLNNGGTGGFNVGGTLVVPPAAPLGSYNGSYSVTVTYN